MGSTEGLMGISRDILGDYYDKHPCPSLSNDVDVLSSQIQAMAFNLLDESADEKLLVDELNRHPFYKIERNLWKNREHIEEIIDLLTPSTHEDTELAGILDNITHVLAHSLTNLVSFLDMISQTVFTAVIFRLPHADARRLVKKLKGQEENDKAKFDDLVASGASIGARCALLWGQQMKRRRELAECCNSIALTRIRYRNTIPNDVLLSLPIINNDEWPMEEQSVRYGPTLHRLTSMILSTRLFLSLLWGRYESAKLNRGQITFVDQVVDAYTREFKKVITFLSDVFIGSPFFKCYDFEEINVAAGETHEVSLKVDAVNSKIDWDFRLASPETIAMKTSMNIDFTVEFIDASENKTIILPKKHCKADKGSFVAVQAGTCRFIWDNSFTLYFTKYVHHKVVCTPPVEETDYKIIDEGIIQISRNEMSTQDTQENDGMSVAQKERKKDGMSEGTQKKKIKVFETRSFVGRVID